MSAELIERLADGVFSEIAHGDDEHKEWLRDSLLQSSTLATQAAEIAELRAAQDTVAGKIADWLEDQYYEDGLAQAIRDGDWK